MYITAEAAYYGEKYDGIFDSIPSEYAEMYEEMDIILHRYDSLLWNHREDLKAYALMYRNVDIDKCSIVDKAFFLDKSNEVIGYYNQIISKSSRMRDNLVEFYLKFDFLFEIYFRNVLGEEMSTLSQNNHNFSIEDCQKIKTKQFDHIFSINDLPENKCRALIDNIKELELSHSDNRYFVNIISSHKEFKDYVANIALPFLLISRYPCDYFKEFVSEYCPNALLNTLSNEQFDQGKILYANSYKPYSEFGNEEIDSLKKELIKLEAPSRELQKLKMRSLSLSSEKDDEDYSFLYSPISTVINPDWTDKEMDYYYERIRRHEDGKKRCEEERRKKKEAKELERIYRIASLEKIMNQNQSYIKELRSKIFERQTKMWDNARTEYLAFAAEIAMLWDGDSSNVWWYLYEHQEELNNYIGTIYKKKYIHYKQLQTGDKVFNQMKLYRKRGIVDFISFISSTNGKSLFEDVCKRKLIQSTQESVCYAMPWAKNWVNYINKILAEKEEKERKQREEEERKRREAEEKRLEQYRFNIRNRHWRDRNVSFREADHVYIVDGTPLDSVTTFVKNCFPEFDAEFHAKRKAEALGITKEAVLEMWDKKGRESREQGTAMHKKIESYYLGKEPSTDDTFDLFKIFADKITLKPYRTEWAVYDWEQKIAGTIDFVDYQNGEYIIYDWKRSDKLIAKNGLPIKNSQYGEKALPPIENLDDSPYYHYALQLSLYKYILEKNYGITVSKLRLGIFHPSYNKPYVLEMSYLQNEIDALFGLRSEVIF